MSRKADQSLRHSRPSTYIAAFAGLHGDGHDDGAHHEICDRRGQADAHHFSFWEAPDTEYQRVVGESANHEATQHNDENKARP